MDRERSELTLDRDDFVNNTSMSAYTMYLDDMTKLSVLKKLKSLDLKDEKGQPLKKGPLAPTIRVLLSMFASGEITITPEQIEQEYLLTTKKNKRSKL